jgi:hypothetical protein
MRRIPASLLPLVLLAGCAGYAADYWRAETSIIAPQLTRYGMDAQKSQCVGPRLTSALSVWQVRQLERVARLVPPGHFGRPELTPQDLVYVASHVRDDRVRPAVTAALDACGLSSAPAAVVAADVPAPADPAATAASAAATPARPLWLNLGAAGSGQSIAVNASSIAEEGNNREAWFRLTNPGESGASPNSYLLRIDCSSRTLNSLAFRRHGPGGEVVEERDYRPAGEGTTAIAGGTVMEIAYLALCT